MQVDNAPSSREILTLALLPLVKRQKFSFGERLKMAEHKATIVAPKAVGSITTNGYYRVVDHSIGCDQSVFAVAEAQSACRPCTPPGVQNGPGQISSQRPFRSGCALVGMSTHSSAVQLHRQFALITL